MILEYMRSFCNSKLLPNSSVSHIYCGEFMMYKKLSPSKCNGMTEGFANNYPIKLMESFKFAPRILECLMNIFPLFKLQTHPVVQSSSNSSNSINRSFRTQLARDGECKRNSGCVNGQA